MDQKWQVTKKILSSRIDGEVVLMSIESDYYFCIDAVGTRVWDLMEKKPLSVNELVQLLLLEYDIDEIKCRKDVEAFINDMASKQLVLPV